MCREGRELGRARQGGEGGVGGVEGAGVRRPPPEFDLRGRRLREAPCDREGDVAGRVDGELIVVVEGARRRCSKEVGVSVGVREYRLAVSEFSREDDAFEDERVRGAPGDPIPVRGVPSITF